MNIFEGARRIAWAIVWLSLVIALYLTFTFKPHSTLHYAISSYGVPAKPIEECQNAPEDATHYINMLSATGRPYAVQLCFVATKSIEGPKLIAYKQSGDFFIMNTKYSEEVKQYIQQVAENYISTNPDKDKIEKILDSKKSEYVGDVFIWLIGFLFFFFILVTGIGWIIRGFAGIPRGSDRRPRPN